MKKLSFVLAALATMAVAAPAVAQYKPMMQDKPMMKEGMEKPKMHRHVQHHVHHHYHHHMAKQPMTDKM
ncbi:MAG: hypothetical protein E8A46_28730 [Bradyrhizobium sp.]|uniref:hypothetical protein n=1 Tax=Bradyrhizobium sp. TaxID=376 RepID=UPI0011F5C983|nr:hypothetical protein [Bradyrhizobium sp.]THD45515.1 MAG: hypothetical protein E8A46_28730 [Bradyrhizobium sp.]